VVSYNYKNKWKTLGSYERGGRIMVGMFGDMFDLNHDGKKSFMEQNLELGAYARFMEEEEEKEKKRNNWLSGDDEDEDDD